MKSRIAPCIVCDQRGYTYPKHSTRPTPKRCHVCNGRGFLEVADKSEQLKEAELQELIAAARKAGTL